MTVYVLFDCEDLRIEGIYLQRNDAQNMMDSFGTDGEERFSIEEHEVVE
jgi:hypothetical protein